jgi:glutamine amidotransferase-like uncharacterized protein
MKKLRFAYPAAVVAALFVLSSCDGGASSEVAGTSSGSVSSGTSQVQDPSSGSSTSTPPASSRTWTTDALLFAGSGTWGTEVSNLENIMDSNGMSYQVVTSSQLDAMSVDQIAQFGLLIFPGGSGGTEAGSLSAQTHANLREAVQVRGVSYIGFCAGSFIAQSPAPASGQDVSYGLGVVAGPELDYYYLENQGTDIAMTPLTFADGSTQDILWYGGPVTPSTAGGVIAKYPDGNPAITELWSGKGFVILSGVHPTANQATLSALGMSSTDGTHQDTAFKLLNAALHQQPLAAM